MSDDTTCRGPAGLAACERDDEGREICRTSEREGVTRGKLHLTRVARSESVVIDAKYYPATAKFLPNREDGR